MKNSIELIDHTFNPWIGWDDFGDRIRTPYENWRAPIEWDREAKAEGRLDRVLCWTDWLDWNAKSQWRIDLLDLIEDTKNLTWLLLTKTPESFDARIMEAFSRSELAREWIDGHFPTNVWIGTSVEDQASADERIPALIEIPAKLRFLSIEPLLGPIDLSPWLTDPVVPIIDWVIVGGESGPGARPIDPEWVLSIRDQCASVNVPFFFKQWGGVNKARTGRILDGRTYDEFPKILSNQ